MSAEKKLYVVSVERVERSIVPVVVLASDETNAKVQAESRVTGGPKRYGNTADDERSFGSYIESVEQCATDVRDFDPKYTPHRAIYEDGDVFNLAHPENKP